MQYGVRFRNMDTDFRVIDNSSLLCRQVQQAHQRLHLKTIMASPAIHWAQNYLIEQGEEQSLADQILEHRQ